MNNDSSPSPTSNLNLSEEAYLSLVNSYINATRDILNGYMTFESGLTRSINSQIFRNFTRSSIMAPRTMGHGTGTGASTETTRQPEQREEPEESVIETPANSTQREMQIPDTPFRPTLRLRSTLQSNSSVPSSPFQIPTPVRLTNRLDTPPTPEEREPHNALPIRFGSSLSQSQQSQIEQLNPPREYSSQTTQSVGIPPFASSFVRYRLPVAVGPPRRVPATSASASATAATASPPPLSHSISPVRQRQQHQEQRQQRQQRELNSLSPILPVEPTPLPPAPSLTSAASRLMLNLLDTPRLNDSLVYYTQIIDRELTRSREGQSEGNNALSYDVIQQQTKIIPYCTINNPLNDICPISQVPFDLIDSVMQINSCKHNFNPYSLIRWFDAHSTCPMCRRQISVDIENDDDDEQPIHMYNEQEEEPYRSESNRYNENNYNFDSEF